jgi:hypothetical protein
MPRNCQLSAQVERALDVRDELHTFTPRAFRLHRAPFSSLEKERPMKVFLRLGVVGFMVLSLWQPAEAARISVSELSGEGAGTIVNDGSNDVSSSNGSAQGDIDFMNELGLTDSSLAADLASLTFLGSIVLADPEFGTATSADLRYLRLIGTVATPCTGCGSVSEAQVGFSSLTSPSGLASTANVVLFSVDLVGPPLTGATPAWKGPVNAPSTLAQPLVVPLATTLSFSLSQAQIDFIVARMLSGTGYDVSDVRLGLGLAANGNGDPVYSTFEVLPIRTNDVPEPGTLTLLAAGMAMAGIRRLKRSARH